MPQYLCLFLYLSQHYMYFRCLIPLSMDTLDFDTCNCVNAKKKEKKNNSKMFEDKNTYNVYLDNSFTHDYILVEYSLTPFYSDIR